LTSLNAIGKATTNIFKQKYMSEFIKTASRKHAEKELGHYLTTLTEKAWSITDIHKEVE